MTGIILMVVGALALVLGIVVYSTNSKDSVAPTESVINSKDDDVEEDDSDLNYKNGLDFEKFVVKKFSPKHFKLTTIKNGTIKI